VIPTIEPAQRPALPSREPGSDTSEPSGFIFCSFWAQETMLVISRAEKIKQLYSHKSFIFIEITVI